MLTFTNTPQHYPDVHSADARKGDFNEIYAHFDPQQAASQASRCSQCGVPFCQIHCPLQNNIPDWLKLTAEGRLEEAYQISSATNTFPEICGRICPQDRLCEGNCVIEKGFNSVTIGAVEKFITENAFAQGWVKPIRVPHETGISIGIIGSGPAGLSAADMLRRQGHEVHIYDRYDRAGGLLIYGIPNFKLEKNVVSRRYQLLQESGIHFHLNHEVKDLEELRQKHDAVLIATGVYHPRDITLPDAQLPGIIQALPYLTASNRKGLGDNVPDFDSGRLNAEGKHAVVIGGGDTAMDCVRTAVRQNAASVTCLYRRDQDNMPGSHREVKNAMEEGVKFMFLSAPKAFVGNGAIRQILVQPMRLATHEPSEQAASRHAVVPVEGDALALPCTLAIKALGFELENIPALFNAPALRLSPYGTLAIDPKTYATSIEGVFAAGDSVRGASLVVWAIKDGRDAAAAIHRYVIAKQQAKSKAA